MSGCIGDDELAAGCREIPVGDIDGDALFAFRPQSICQQGKVYLPVLTVPGTALNRFELVGEDAFAVVQEPADQGTLAVIHTSGRYESE
jgi:hypothetical protein